MHIKEKNFKYHELDHATYNESLKSGKFNSQDIFGRKDKYKNKCFDLNQEILICFKSDPVAHKLCNQKYFKFNGTSIIRETLDDAKNIISKITKIQKFFLQNNGNQIYIPMLGGSDAGIIRKEQDWLHEIKQKAQRVEDWTMISETN